MAGVKGRSGRRPKKYNPTIEAILKESNHVVYVYLRDDSQPIEKRAEVAARFSTKHMPQKIEVEDKKALPLEEKQALIEGLKGLFASNMPISSPIKVTKQLEE